jgi:hypothetical protein
MDAETYKRHHLRNLASSLRKRSMVMDDTMLGNYEESLNRGARLRLQVQPQPDFSIDDFGYYRPVDYPELLGVRLAANNLPTSKPTAAAIALDAEPDVETATINPADEPARQHRERDNTLEWGDLGQALHQDILVHTHSGGVHKGRLEKVDNYLLVLKKTIGAGSMSYTIDKRRFARAELITQLDTRSRISAF